MKKTKAQSWGNYPNHQGYLHTFVNEQDMTQLIESHHELIAQANNRSYGDSAFSEHMLKTNALNYFLDFDEKKGLLHTQSGVLLSKIIEIFVPKGWFLPVVPGTKLISIGGAIASDVHGKNHHLVGCFSQFVESLTLLLPTGKKIECSKTENNQLFYATCGGMGLTGVIIDAKIKLQKISSKNFEQTTIKTANLKETFEVFEQYKNMPYSVIWLDCLANGDKLGRGLLTVGDFAKDTDLDYQNRKKINFPCFLPSFFLNSLSVKIFNFLYYQKIMKKVSLKKVSLDQFFFPLDGLNNWNRMYGKQGFVQYQVIFPLEKSYDALSELLQKIAQKNKGSFLAVLKLYGKQNKNYLSFPMQGYSLALDFKIEKGIWQFLEELDTIVLKYQGRFYLAKDARVSKEVFEKGYPQIETFRKLRKQYQMTQKFSSIQSKRLQI